MYIFVLISFLLSLGFMPLIIKFCNRRKLYDYQDERKIHSGNIPRLGGIGIFSSFLISSVIFLITSNNISIWDNFPILIAGLIIFVCGTIDDLKNLPAIVKLLFQLTAVTIVTMNGYRFTRICSWEIPTVLSYLLTFGWILGVINAYNLIDGLDGLCGTLTFTALVTLGILYTLSGKIEANLCFILAGSILGFLCFNWPPAKIFMGDNGSQFLGFMLATIPFYSSGDVFEYNKFFIMIILTAFPVFDTIAAIWRRLREKRDIMSGDRSHLHHKLLNLGYTRKQALMLITVLQILLCATVILSHFLGHGEGSGSFVSSKGTAILIEAAGFVILFFGIIHFSNKKITKQKAEAEVQKEGEIKSETENSSNSEKKD